MSVCAFLMTASADTNCLSQIDNWNLEFPERSVGTIGSYEHPSMNRFGYLDWPSGATEKSDAVKLVPVDKSKFLFLRVNGNAEDLEFLREFPAASVNALELSNLKIGAAEFDQIGRLKNLKLLRLENCTLAKGLDPKTLAVASNAEQISFRLASDLASDLDGAVGVFSQWASRCPKLGNLRCGTRNFKTEEIAHFTGHSKISFLSVSLGTDTSELCSQLSRIAGLRGLNLLVTKNAPHDYGQHLESSGSSRVNQLVGWVAG